MREVGLILGIVEWQGGDKFMLSSLRTSIGTSTVSYCEMIYFMMDIREGWGVKGRQTPDPRRSELSGFSMWAYSEGNQELLMDT